MALPPLFLVQKAAALDLEETLPQFIEGSLDSADSLHFCALYRRFAICRLLFSGVPDEFYGELFKSGRAYLHYIQRAGSDSVVTGKAAPFFDAVACDDMSGAADIARNVDSSWSEGEEYEEDFLYVRFLMEKFCLATEQGILEARLARYEEVLDGQPDPRLDLCKGILAADGAAFEQALLALLSDEQARMERLVAEEKLDPDDSSTIARVSIEGLALVRLGQQVGLEAPSACPLVPEVARRFARAVHPPAESWREIESHASL